jgi:CheY-like chemotaxis protein
MVSRAKTSTQPLGRILLVDDNKGGLMARGAVLEEIGYRVEGALSGEKALALFREHLFDLVVTDYRIPDMDGSELIASIREKRDGVPIVLLSGFVDALGLNELNTGADVVIMKSANEVPHLIRAVSRLLKLPKKPPLSEKPRRVRLTRKAAGN